MRKRTVKTKPADRNNLFLKSMEDWLYDAADKSGLFETDQYQDEEDIIITVQLKNKNKVS